MVAHHARRLVLAHRCSSQTRRTSDTPQVTDANRDTALSREPISEAEHEVTLRAERPVVEKEAVPVERVRLGTEEVTGEQEVSETVRKEQIEEPDLDSGPDRPGR
jgi:stress response protein YsnF